jgi:hypothetical protein
MASQRKTEHVITADDLSEYLSGQDDFALELFVYHTAKQLGFGAMHGGTYTDPVTKKPRQFDVRASRQVEACRLDLSIECKTLQPTYPLLLSRIPRSAAESFHQLVHHDIEAATATRPVAPFLYYATAVTRVGSSSIYHAGDLIAKTIRQVSRDDKDNFRSGDEGVYDKWAQALASADELIARAEGGRGG